MNLRRNSIIVTVSLVFIQCAAAQEEIPHLPRPDWTKEDTSDIFYKDAFKEAFDGKIPFHASDFHGPDSSADNKAAITTTPKDQSPGGDWQEPLDVELLIDEIKLISARAQMATRSTRSFAGDAKDDTERDFVIASAIFKGLSLWNGKVRFKDDADASGATLLEAARTIGSPSGEAHAVAKRATAELNDLIRGSHTPSESRPSPTWQQIVRRGDFMARLDIAVEDELAAGLKSKAEMESSSDALVREANLAAALLVALRQESAIDSEHADYIEFCRTAEKRAVELRSAIQQHDFEHSSRGLKRLRQACEACHDQYQ